MQGVALLDKKIHPCPWEGCGRKFTCNHNVQQHIREKHTGEKPYRCPECNFEGREKGFARPFMLNRHRKQLHGVDVGPGRGGQKRKVQSGETFPNNEDFTNRQAPRAVQNAGATSMQDFDLDLNQIFQFGATAEQPEYVTAGNFEDRQYQKMQQAETTYAQAYDPDLDKLFDFESATGQQQAGTIRLEYACESCPASFGSQDAMLNHLHGMHNAPSSPFCSCSVCDMVHRSHGAAADLLAKQLRTGGFTVGSGRAANNNMIASIDEANSNYKPSFADAVIDPQLNGMFPNISYSI